MFSFRRRAWGVDSEEGRTCKEEVDCTDSGVLDAAIRGPSCPWSNLDLWCSHGGGFCLLLGTPRWNPNLGVTLHAFQVSSQFSANMINMLPHPGLVQNYSSKESQPNGWKINDPLLFLIKFIVALGLQSLLLAKGPKSWPEEKQQNFISKTFNKHFKFTFKIRH